MTANPVTVHEDTPVEEIARLFETRHIKRVPVMRGTALVGLVSRANLIQALAAAGPAKSATGDGSDAAIRETLIKELRSHGWWRGWETGVTVRDGIVSFWGAYETEDDRAAARVAAENVAGVRRVDDHRTRRSDLVGAE